MSRPDTAPRDPRGAAPVVGMDLSRPTDVIHYDLAARFKQHPFLWWELEEDEKTGWVYSKTTHIIAKLVHVDA